MRQTKCRNLFFHKAQSRESDCGLTCSVRKPAVNARRPLRKAPVDGHGTPVEKAPIGRAAAVATRRAAVGSARRHQFANCHHAHRAAAV